MKQTLNKYHKNYYSQNGEDGIIEEVLKRLGIEDGFCVEFGAWNGKYLSNTYHLVKQYIWKALYIEGDPEKFSDLLENEMVLAGMITPINAYVTSDGDNTVDRILAKHQVPRDFELLSVDIDGSDLDVWASVTKYKPKIVIIEVNSFIEPTVSRVLADGRPEKSFANMLKLGQEKGYTLVCHTGNMIFVLNELVSKLGIDSELANPTVLFCDRWIKKKRNHFVRFRNKLRGFLKSKCSIRF